MSELNRNCRAQRDAPDLHGYAIPDNERWLHEPENKAKLDAAIAWAEANPSCSDNLSDIEAAVHGR